MPKSYQIKQYGDLTLRWMGNEWEWEYWQEKGIDNQYGVAFQVLLDTDIVGIFNFATLTGCCGVVVSSGTYVYEKYRGTKASNDFRELKTQLAKDLGYSMMIATNDMEDVHATRNMMKSGYTYITQFVNSRTENTIGVGIKRL